MIPGVVGDFVALVHHALQLFLVLLQTLTHHEEGAAAVHCLQRIHQGIAHVGFGTVIEGQSHHGLRKVEVTAVGQHMGGIGEICFCGGLALQNTFTGLCRRCHIQSAGFLHGFDFAALGCPAAFDEVQRAAHQPEAEVAEEEQHQKGRHAALPQLLPPFFPNCLLPAAKIADFLLRVAASAAAPGTAAALPSLGCASAAGRGACASSAVAATASIASVASVIAASAALPASCGCAAPCRPIFLYSVVGTSVPAAGAAGAASVIPSHTLLDSFSWFCTVSLHCETTTF